VLGFVELFRESHPDRSTVILRIPETQLILGLVEFTAANGNPFTPQRTGLDHLCFAAASHEDLQAWAGRLDDHGVSHSGVVEMATSPIVIFKDPGGIALAIALPPHQPQ
jgi:glyoxylase I family protein